MGFESTTHNEEKNNIRSRSKEWKDKMKPRQILERERKIRLARFNENYVLYRNDIRKYNHSVYEVAMSTLERRRRFYGSYSLQGRNKK